MSNREGVAAILGSVFVNLGNIGWRVKHKENFYLETLNIFLSRICVVFAQSGNTTERNMTHGFMTKAKQFVQVQKRM